MIGAIDSIQKLGTVSTTRGVELHTKHRPGDDDVGLLAKIGGASLDDDPKTALTYGASGISAYLDRQSGRPAD